VTNEAKRSEESGSTVRLCPSCNGNDKDAPCAYPSEGRTGCLRDERVTQLKMKQQYEDIGVHGQFCGCHFCNPIV
jgi:hypothetical protein